MITVLHDLNLATQYCDRLILIDGDKVYKSGSPEEVITKANIRTGYQAEAEVKVSTATDHPYVMPISKQWTSSDATIVNGDEGISST